jgi:hypothetical protein
MTRADQGRVVQVEESRRRERGQGEEMESFLEKPKRMGPVTRSYIRFPGGSTRIWKGVDESVVGERLRPCDGWTGTLHRRGEGGI